MNNVMNYMSNPKVYTLKKWFYDLLKLKYASHDQIIERVATSLVTDKDVEDFGKLIGEVFELGFRKAGEEYGKQIEALGYKVHIVAPTQNSDSCPKDSPA